MSHRWFTYESQMDLKWFTDGSHMSHRMGLQMCHRWSHMNHKKSYEWVTELVSNGSHVSHWKLRRWLQMGHMDHKFVTDGPHMSM